MPLFETGNKIKPFWKFSQTGNLWRVFATKSGTLIGETRDLKNKKLYFFSVNITDGKINFKDYLFEDNNYWVSIESYNSEIFFLHRFENPNLPDTKCIIAINYFTGEVLWENSNLKYYFSTEEEIYAYKEKFESFDYFILDKNDGKIIRQIPEEEYEKVNKIREEVLINLNSNNKFTQIYDENSDSREIGEILDSQTERHNICSDVEYIKEDKYLIFSYYSKKVSKEKNQGQITLNNKIFIFELPECKKVFEDVLNSEANYAVPDCFFMRGNYLFYLKNKKEIITLNLI